MDVETWWRRLGSAALVGTARRPVPSVAELGMGEAMAVTPRADARPEEAALDAAALGGALRRAGRLPPAGTTPPTAAEESRPAAPPRAAQLLELLLVQPPTDAAATDMLLQHWCTACHEAGCRVPHRLLPTLLERARSAELRHHVALAVGERGSWLATHNPDWSWLAKPTRTGSVPADPSEQRRGSHVDLEAWALLGIDQRAAQLRSLRSDDPAAARGLLLTSWAGDSAKDRKALLETLSVGLGPDDEDLLESALDDPAASVRDLAAQLLDGLPASRRAARMADRLRPLVSEKGRLRRQLEFTLPDDPDVAGRRDGLGKPPPGRSARGWWLSRIVAGSPYDVWGGPAEKVVPRIHHEDVLAGLRRAAVMRRTADWARALLEHGTDLELLAVLPSEERAARVLDELRQTPPRELATLLDSLSPPWSPQLSSAVVERIARLKPEETGTLLESLVPLLVRGLHQDALPALQRWRDKAQLPRRYDDRLGSLIQSRTLRATISEAFP